MALTRKRQITKGAKDETKDSENFESTAEREKKESDGASNAVPFNQWIDPRPAHETANPAEAEDE